MTAKGPRRKVRTREDVECRVTAGEAIALGTSDGLPSLRAGLAALIDYAVRHSDSAQSAARALGLSGPRQLQGLARRHGVRLPWSSKGGKR